MLIDIPIVITVDADNELDAKELAEMILNDAVLTENKFINWNFLNDDPEREFLSLS